jgi:hypothetical protein
MFCRTGPWIETKIEKLSYLSYFSASFDVLCQKNKNKNKNKNFETSMKGENFFHPIFYIVK